MRPSPGLLTSTPSRAAATGARAGAGLEAGAGALSRNISAATGTGSGGLRHRRRGDRSQLPSTSGWSSSSAGSCDDWRGCRR
ncbi:hypothetical protein CHLRE_12g535476v5 [Chlamydomonas reinhardtii]|uniref:Uncharacterized protein n=1 Tax=Chlamydomonas reinhardtii TaxID=3055 RepID=A0A2K3D550_CHLRE|nr:uncharacterized protein CHLRE_12g535476v5 [Chlamydomonas reinhardtii]PNW75654.1 hypothetical protein CHLRE_12g535476v5 [Chlamydomonas reinhardtii]